MQPVYLVGCGGVASYLLPVLYRSLDLCNLSSIVLIDGDRLEEKNLDRQLFRPEDVGLFKAVALARQYPERVTAWAQWFVPGISGIEWNPIIIGCVDNHVARRAILDTVDTQEGCCFLGANEYWESEAYFYDYRMRGTAHDPRVFYPTLLTEDGIDPARPRGCTGDVLESSPQLAAANAAVATLIMHLILFHRVHLKDNPELQEMSAHHPLLHRNNVAAFTTVKRKDR